MSSRSVTALIALAALLAVGVGAADSTPAEQAIARYATAWAGVHSYRCTLTEHEVLGSRTQDRVYHMAFEKPHDTRFEIVEGPGQGSVLVWRGGPKARGHRGGWLRFIVLTVGLSDSRATSLRGTTIAQANFGYLLDHLRSLDTASVKVETRDGRTEIHAVVANPDSDAGITQEVYVLGASGLPVEYRQLKGQQVVRDVSYSDVEVNVPIPPSDFEL